MTEKQRRLQAQQFLANAMPFPGERRFILGTFERGITLYRQQIRALNLVYALVTTKRVHLRKPRARAPKIAVIGGGAFGSTAAVAAAFAGYRVLLLERHQTLLQLQRGCDTRWIHPRFYDWPAPESESQMARLPFLDWTASSAGNVALQITRGIENLQNGVLAGRLDIELGVPEIQVESISGESFEVRYRSAAGQHIRGCEAVIYAVGFGYETNHGASDSYWRNDPYGQYELGYVGKKIRYVVSGVGDGGLVDLFRLTLREFRYEHIFSDMFPGRGKPIHRELEHIRTAFKTSKENLFDKLADLEEGEHKKVVSLAKDVLRERLRGDTAVTLNGSRSSFRSSLFLDSMSFSNALLAYLLFRVDAFHYKQGTLDLTTSGKPKVLKTKGKGTFLPLWLKRAKPIVRHGIRREEALRAVGCAKAIDFLRARADMDSGRQIFPAGWWGQYVEPEATLTAKSRHSGIEYVPPVLRTHATTFVATVASMLKGIIDQKKPRRSGSRKFRVALHRLTHFDGEDVFQQITPYKGRDVSPAGVGRFFPVRGGIVGLACRTGSLVVARKVNKTKFRELWDLADFHLTGAKGIKPYVDSLLCCPFFAAETRPRRQRILLALFVDSADPNLFDERTLRVISAACRGFVDLLESLHDERMLRVLPSSHSGYEVFAEPGLDRLAEQLKGLGVKFVDASDSVWKKDLTFATLQSTDLQSAEN